MPYVVSLTVASGICQVESPNPVTSEGSQSSPSPLMLPENGCSSPGESAGLRKPLPRATFAPLQAMQGEARCPANDSQDHQMATKAIPWSPSGIALSFSSSTHQFCDNEWYTSRESLRHVDCSTAGPLKIVDPPDGLPSSFLAALIRARSNLSSQCPGSRPPGPWLCCQDLADALCNRRGAVETLRTHHV